MSLRVVRCHLARGVGRLLDLVVGATSPSLPPACRPDRGGASLRERAYGIALIYLILRQQGPIFGDPEPALVGQGIWHSSDGLHGIVWARESGQMAPGSVVRCHLGGVQ